MEVAVKDEIVVGDCVLLNCADSELLLRACDIEGCQIWLDGEVESIEGKWCSVLVKCEQLGRIVVMVMFKTRLSWVKAVERAHEWTRLNAKAVDRVRRTGSEEYEFWAPLSVELLHLCCGRLERRKYQPLNQLRDESRQINGSVWGFGFKPDRRLLMHRRDDLLNSLQTNVPF